MPVIPAFLARDSQRVPLIDKKRISSKTKRIMKEMRPLAKPPSEEFISYLSHGPSHEELRPAIVVMPSPRQCDTAVHKSKRSAQGNRDNWSSSHHLTVLLNHWPLLKTDLIRFDVMARRVLSLHEEPHPATGWIDTVFTTPEAVVRLTTRVKSVVWCVSPAGDPAADRVSRLIQRVKHLAVRYGINITGCSMVPHLPGVDVADTKAGISIGFLITPADRSDDLFRRIEIRGSNKLSHMAPDFGLSSRQANGSILEYSTGYSTQKTGQKTSPNIKPDWMIYFFRVPKRLP